MNKLGVNLRLSLPNRSQEKHGKYDCHHDEDIAMKIMKKKHMT